MPLQFVLMRGTRLRKLREEAGFKFASDFAERFGFPEPTFRSHDNGVRKLTTAAAKSYAKVLARALGRPISWLYLIGEVDDEASGASHRPEALLVGKVGAGAQVVRFEEGVVLEGVEPPAGLGGCLAARVEGDSMFPFEDGWLIFYGAEHRGIADEAIGRLSVVGLPDGTTLVKKLRRGSKRGLWSLESWNAPMREDVRLAWASRVIDIRPT